MISLNNLRRTLADRLAYYRDRKGWTQHDLAAACEPTMSASGIRGYEQRKRWPDPEEIEVLAKALEVEPLDLLIGPSLSSKEGDLAKLNQVLRGASPQTIEQVIKIASHLLDAEKAVKKA